MIHMRMVNFVEEAKKFVEVREARSATPPAYKPISLQARVHGPQRHSWRIHYYLIATAWPHGQKSIATVVNTAAILGN